MYCRSIREFKLRIVVRKLIKFPVVLRYLRNSFSNIFAPLKLITPKLTTMSFLSELEQIDHNLPLSTAVEMVTRFRSALPSMLMPPYTGSLPFAETLNKSVFEELCNEENCVAIRAYFALDAENRICLIFVGVNEENEDLLPDIDDDDDFAIFEYGQRCPPICAAGPLNPQL